jgi:hypothetical protein
MSSQLAQLMAHQIGQHDANPIHDDEVVIPIIVEDLEVGKQIIRDVAQALRNEEMPAWISKTGQEMLFGKLRVFVDNNPIDDPLSLREFTCLMAVLPPVHRMSAYKRAVLDEVINSTLMNARVMGYQGFVHVLDSTKEFDNGERYL